jgi:hypothetical protein
MICDLIHTREIILILLSSGIPVLCEFTFSYVVIDYFLSYWDPGIEIRGGGHYLRQGGLGTALKPPVGPGRNPCGGPRGRSPQKLLDVTDSIRPKT